VPKPTPAPHDVWGQQLNNFLSNLVISVEDYGAVGDGVTDDTAAIRNALTAANALARVGLTGTIFHPGATVLFPRGTYALTSLAAPLDILCNVQGANAQLLIQDAYSGIAVRVGHTTSGSLFQNAVIDLPDVTKSNSASIVTNSVGTRVMNLSNSKLTFGRTAYFETGIHFTGLGQGTAYNQINIGWVSYSKVSIKLLPDTGGWVNQNTFVGGGIQQSPGAFGGGLHRSGWRHLVLDGASINPVNGNTFVGTSFEGDVSEYTFHITNAYDNVWVGTRHETGTTPTAVTASASSANLSSTAHGLAVGDMVYMNASSLPGGMHAAPWYVISVADANTFTISQQKGGTAVVFSSAGSGVTFLRPQRIYLDTSGGTVLNNVIRDPMTSTGFLEIVNPSAAGAGNNVHSVNTTTLDNYYTDGAPPFRARNRNSSPTNRPMFAAYPSGANPVENPHGWTAAIGDTGLLFSTSGTEQGRVSQSGGVLNYKRPADSVSYELASCRRSPSLISIVSLSLTATTTTTTTVTLTGASTNDHVVITPSANLPAGVAIAYARVSAADTITIGFLNITGSPISLTVDIQAIAIRRFF